MRRYLNLAALVGALAVSGISSGQSNYYPINLSFRAGGVFPIDDNLADLGNSLFGLGIDYRIDKPFFEGGETFFSLDWFSGTTTGRKGNVFPVMVNQKWYTRQSEDGSEGSRSYFFLGAGAVFIDVAGSDTVIGLRGGVGVELGSAFFTEGTFFISDRARGDVRATAAGVYLGYRF
ncbi:MAG: hypothetical protein WAO58_12140 [Fimbriimonadaceae bacterium]